VFTDNPSSKVTAAQLAKNALLYVRQSSLKQVIRNTESAVRQYDLQGKAIALGWQRDQIEVIDIDQGQSGASAADRAGFQHLVAEVGLGHAGIVLGLECSRLARNSADWQQLLELCAATGTLICDEDGLYDPALPNDSLLLGMKGQMSAFELHILKGRLRGGQLSKARRGELILPLPVGLAYTPAGKVTLDPDSAVQQAVRRLFAEFTRTGSAYGVVAAFRHAGLTFPWRHTKGPRTGELDWKPLAHHTVLRVLHNPRYAGCFVYGRTRHAKLPGAKATSSNVPRENWFSFRPGAHDGYITLAGYDTNLAKLAANAAAHGRDRAGGPPREGAALLQGIVICGRCGKRMTVRYHRSGNADIPTYACQRDGIETATPICQAIPGQTLDTAIGDLLLATLTPLAIEAALAVTTELQQRADEADTLRAAHVTRAQYHADLARRRFLAVDPGNRLVAETLEADWNTALRDLKTAQDAYHAARADGTGQLTGTQRDKIRQLLTDLPALWNDPATPVRERKRITRLLITDVTLTRDRTTITAAVRFPGGTDTTLTLPVPLTAAQMRKTPATVVQAIDQLLDQHTSGQIAGILNDRGLKTGTGEQFHRLIVDHIIKAYRLPTRRARLLAHGMITPGQLAAALHVDPQTIKTYRRNGIVTGICYNDKGEHLYHPIDPASPPKRPAIGRPRNPAR